RARKAGGTGDCGPKAASGDPGPMSVSGALLSTRRKTRRIAPAGFSCRIRPASVRLELADFHEVDSGAAEAAGIDIRALLPEAGQIDRRRSGTHAAAHEARRLDRPGERGET